MNSDDDINNLEQAVCGSIPMERLEQFVEEDTWYFSDGDSDDGSVQDITETEWPKDPEESLLPKEGCWFDLSNNNTIATMPPKTDTDNSLDQSMGLKSVIDYFLARLEPYNATYDEEETTDNGGVNRASDTNLLIEEEGGSQAPTPVGTLERSGTTSVQEQEDLCTDSREEKDHAKPLPAVVLSKRPKYFFIANEILTSERTYVQGIRMLEKVLHGAVKTARDAGKPMIPETVRKRIFLNISEIHTLNTDFLNELEDRIESWELNPIICDILASRAPYFKLYSMYAARFENSQTAYGEALKKHKPFYELVQHIENSNLCKGLPVTSYMLYPIQRIPRYKLLLKDYLKNLPENHADRSYTEEALKTISEVAQHLNDRIKDLEEQATVVKLQKLFSGKETLVVPGRKFVLRGPVELVSGKKLNRRKTRVLFLFSDVLLLTKISRNIKFKILMKFSLADVQVSSMYSQSQENDFCVFLPSATKPFRFCARDRKERDVWVKYLRRSSLIEIEKRKSFDSIKRIHLITLNKRSIQSICQDPSFERKQSKLTKKTFHPRHQMIVNAANPSKGIEETDGGTEETDGGTEETDGGTEDIMLGMELMDDQDDDDDSFVLQPGLDNSLSSYINYKREGSSSKGEEFVEMWFVLTYTGLTGYCNHKTDEACWALVLAGCRMILSTQNEYTIKLVTPVGLVHVFQLNNEYDYTRWTGVLQETLNSDVNRI